jgi:serine/threonine protein kinase/pSer/pThr/pTyr-binding forkhead associated (FHA) protein
MTTGTLQLESYFGPYFLEKLIAIGGMAEIYLARTRGLAGFEKQLVLKVIQPELAGNDQFVQMLVDEAKIAVGLNHPNIAQTFDLGKISNSYFISMEFVDGADFFQILKGLSDMEVDIPIDAAVYVVHEALCGLDYAHNKRDTSGSALQIIHRDISPQNILLSRHGEVKIVDFGIAKAANLSHKTRAGVIKGKLVYMSPEQAWGDKVDHRTDIFSAGIVLYEALTMGSLYLEKNPAKLLERVRRAAIDPPSRRRPEIPGELDVLVMKALTPRPADRYQSANEFAEALADYQRRTAPEFSEQELGSLVESVLAGEKPKAAAGPQASQTGEMMLREDFAPQEHSMIFSAEDLMESSPNLARPRTRTAGGPTPGRGVPAHGAQAGRQVAKLVLLDGEREGEPFVIEDQFVIGRTGDLRLGDARVSRRHAIIKRQPSGFLVEDLKSANGTYLNGTKIDQPCTLQHGDVIRVGPFEMRFTLEHEATEAEAVQLLAPAPASAPASTAAPASVASASAAVVASRPGTSQKAVTTPKPAPQPTPTPQRSDGARISLTMGAESLTLPVGANLRLAHTLDVGEINLEAETATLVRKPDGYWLEPAAGRETVLHNGRKVAGPVQLAAGDKVQVGPVQLEFLGEG